MVDRAYRLSSNWSFFSEECDRLRRVFHNLKYPKPLVETTIKRFVERRISSPGGLLGYKRRSLIFCTQKYTRLDILDPKKYIKKYAQIFQTQKNTRLNLQPKKIQELKILDPKKYVGPPPSRLYLSNPPGISSQEPCPSPDVPSKTGRLVLPCKDQSSAK